MSKYITDSMDVSLSQLPEFMMDREAWRAAIHGVTKSWTRLRDWTELNSIIWMSNPPEKYFQVLPPGICESEYLDQESLQV